MQEEIQTQVVEDEKLKAAVGTRAVNLSQSEEEWEERPKEWAENKEDKCEEKKAPESETTVEDKTEMEKEKALVNPWKDLASSSSTSKDIRKNSTNDTNRNTHGREKPRTGIKQKAAETNGGKRKKVYHGGEEVKRRKVTKEVTGTTAVRRGQVKEAKLAVRVQSFHHTADISTDQGAAKKETTANFVTLRG